jgi:hypothetical protein
MFLLDMPGKLSCALTRLACGGIHRLKTTGAYPDLLGIGPELMQNKHLSRRGGLVLITATAIPQARHLLNPHNP